jgi:hypothetical protein
MAFTPPVFNLLADVWFCGNTPFDGDPDVENQAVQLYLPSRVVVANDRPTDQYFVSAIQIRLPFENVVNWQSAFIYECPAESGRYFLACFKEYQHLGFPNQYLLTGVLQCDDTGEPIMRDVCPSLGPDFHSLSGVGDIGADFQSQGEINGGTGPETHNASGAGEVTAEYSADGEIENIPATHTSVGSGEVTFDATSDGSIENLG